MIFTSFEFVCFFGAMLVLRALVRDLRWEKTLLVIGSYCFYMSWSVPCGFLLLATSVVDYLVGIGLEKIETARKRRLLLLISIVANLGVLGFFKYTNFAVENIAALLNVLGLDVKVGRLDILLPAGISFFTFQSMTYTIEKYRRRLPACHSLKDFLLFVAFFPQLLAGPINRAVDLLPQFSRRLRATVFELEQGISQFLLGAIKKLVISDQVAPTVDLVFGAPDQYNGISLLTGLVGYSLQIYCDFSGYSDMAIGTARMMGFKFMENFQMPYSAVNITEFWRRWHISLSSWFRDYLYIPLGGNRKGPWRTYSNLLVTMVLCGLWHGASWNFIAWGLLHGVGLAVHRLWSRRREERGPVANGMLRWVAAPVSRLATLMVVGIGWVLFRASDWGVAMDYLSRLGSFSSDGIAVSSPQVWAAAFGVALCHFMVGKDRNWAMEVPSLSSGRRIVIYSAELFLLASLGATDSAPFIYFQF